MLLDPETLDLVQHIDSVLARSRDGAFEARINPELMQSVIEITTPVCRDCARGTMHSVHSCARYVAEIARSRRLPLRLGGYASVQPLRAAADHRAGTDTGRSSTSSSTSHEAS